MMNNIIRHILTISSIAAVVLSTGCNTESNVNCIQCISKYDSVNHLKIKPDSVKIKIYITTNSQNQKIIITLFKGKYNIPEPTIVLTTTITKDTSFKVPVDNDYSVKAEYNVGSKKVFAIDGCSLNAKEIKQACDTICWLISGDKLDVRLAK